MKVCLFEERKKGKREMSKAEFYSGGAGLLIGSPL